VHTCVHVCVCLCKWLGGCGFAYGWVLVCIGGWVGSGWVGGWLDEWVSGSARVRTPCFSVFWRVSLPLSLSLCACVQTHV